MHQKRHNIAIQSRGCFQHTNTLWPSIHHTPSRDSKASIVVLTNLKNQKIEHQRIRWEDLTFPEHWVVSNPKPPPLKRITSADIQENQSSAVLSFPRRSTIDYRGIERSCKSSRFYRDPSTINTACSSSISCKHVSLFEFAQLVNFNSLEVTCLECKAAINLCSLAESFIHENHHPRTGESPPSTSVNPCPNPKCSDIPFPMSQILTMF